MTMKKTHLIIEIYYETLCELFICIFLKEGITAHSLPLAFLL